MSSPQPLPPKKEVALALLERSSVYVHLDPRQTAVVVPAWFKKQAQLVLQIGLNMPMPIPDLCLDDEGISCTLSFKGQAFPCVVPWPSVFAMVGEDGRGMVWPDDVPAEVARQAQVRVVDTGVRKEPPKASMAVEKDLKDAKLEGVKAKRPRKRVPLAAVPDGEDQPKKSTKPTRVPFAERAQAHQTAPRPVVAPPPVARPMGNGSRKKRELPPYLRVVK
jgi:stringent starvation protein B